jgi:hypothetical protein
MQPMPFINSSTTDKTNKKSNKKTKNRERVFILENFLAVSIFYIIDLQGFKNIFGKLSLK